MKKRLLSILLTLAMVISLFPGMAVTASAESAESAESAPTGGCNGNHEGATEIYGSSSLYDAFVEGTPSGTYYLSTNIWYSHYSEDPLYIRQGTEVTLCLNGYDLDLRSTHYFRVEGTLNICDCNSSNQTHKFSGNENGGWTYDSYSGTILQYGGIINGAARYDANPYGCVFYVDGGTLNLKGGTIAGNEASPIRSSASANNKVNISGGAINGNGNCDVNDYDPRLSYYAMVHMDGGDFTMTGGEISQNFAIVSKVCGLYFSGNCGNVSLTGGKITENRCKNGNGVAGGVYFDLATGDASAHKLTLGGDIQITDNRVAKDSVNFVSNLALPSADKCTTSVTAFNSGAQVGVTLLDNNGARVTSVDAVEGQSDVFVASGATADTTNFITHDREGLQFVLEEDRLKLTNPSVTFDFCDGVTPPVEQETSVAAPAPADLERHNTYTFAGWYTGKFGTGTKLVSTPEGGATYYAKWVVKDSNPEQLVIAEPLDFANNAANLPTETAVYTYSNGTLTLNNIIVDAPYPGGSSNYSVLNLGDCTVVLNPGTTNYIYGQDREVSDADYNYGITFSGNSTVQGAGTLYVYNGNFGQKNNGPAGVAITAAISNGYGTLTIKDSAKVYAYGGDVYYTNGMPANRANQFPHSIGVYSNGYLYVKDGAELYAEGGEAYFGTPENKEYSILVSGNTAKSFSSGIMLESNSQVRISAEKTADGTKAGKICATGGTAYTSYGMERARVIITDDGKITLNTSANAVERVALRDSKTNSGTVAVSNASSSSGATVTSMNTSARTLYHENAGSPVELFLGPVLTMTANSTSTFAQANQGGSYSITLSADLWKNASGQSVAVGEVPVKLRDGEGNLVKELGTITYETSTTLTADLSGIPVGNYVVVATAVCPNENIAPTLEATQALTINAKSGSNFTVTLNLPEGGYTYDGNAKMPGVADIKDGDYTLQEGEDKDYTLSYSSNTDAGTATVTVTYKNNYTSSKQQTFTIAPLALVDGNGAFTQDVTEHTFVFVDETLNSIIKCGDKTLTKGEDFTESNPNASEGTATITFINNYSGTYNVTGAPAKFSIRDNWFEITSGNTFTYDGTVHAVEIGLTGNAPVGITAAEYEIIYKKSGTEATPKNVDTYDVYVSAKGDTYFGETTSIGTITISKRLVDIQPKAFTVTAGAEMPTFELELSNVIAGDDVTFTYVDFTPEFTIVDKDGNAIPDTDGTLENIWEAIKSKAGTYRIVWTNPNEIEGYFDGTHGVNYWVGSLVEEATLTIARRPSSGSSSDTPVTVPVSNDENKVNVNATLSGQDATIKPLDSQQIEQIVGDTEAAGDVVVDLTGLGKTIDTAGIPKASLEAIVEAAEDAGNDTEHLVIKLSTAELKLDDAALRAIVDQARGDVILFNFDDVGLNRMNAAQRYAVKDMDIRKGFEAYITVNGSRISDFKGGNVEIIVPYTVPAGEDVAGFSVWYIDEQGNPEKLKSTYDGKQKWFVVTHFSDYVIAYSAEDALSGSYHTCPKDETCPIHPYTDALTKAWYHDGIHYCIDNGLMSGYGNGIFQPDADTTRAMIAMMLWRLEGSPKVDHQLDFADVAEGQWYTDAIRWVNSAGIAAGYDDGRFGADDAVTREQMATMLLRYAQYKGIDVSVGEETNILSYDDAFEISGYAVPAMQWACGSGIMQGMNDPDGDGMLLAPKSKGTRAQIATMMMRFCEGVVKK